MLLQVLPEVQTGTFQLVPWFMVDVLNAPGFPGLFVAVLFSGALRYA